MMKLICSNKFWIVYPHFRPDKLLSLGMPTIFWHLVYMEKENGRRSPSLT
jgi:hypothetical protein